MLDLSLADFQQTGHLSPAAMLPLRGQMVRCIQLRLKKSASGGLPDLMKREPKITSVCFAISVGMSRETCSIYYRKELQVNRQF